MTTEWDLETVLVGGDTDLDVDPDGLVPAIHQSVVHGSVDSAAFDDLNEQVDPERYYRRYGNPTTARLGRLMARLEGAEVGLVTASGMGAITATVLALTSAGDHVVAQRSMYGGTLSLLHDLTERFGVEVTFVDQTRTEELVGAIGDRTRLVMLETPSNPLLSVTDLRTVCAAARAVGVPTLVDNTVATPANQRPIELGADVVMHSLTKAASGHGDVQAGVLLGSAELLERVWRTHTVLGAVASPFDAWLALRGLRTLALRVRHQNRNAQALAEQLAAHARVNAVHYPGLTDHPQHQLARSQMHGFGGLLSVELEGGRAAAETFVEHLRLAVIGPSLGATRTLVVRPASMWSNELTEAELEAAGVPSGLVRMAVGLEHERDLLDDVSAALEAAAGAASGVTTTGAAR